MSIKNFLSLFISLSVLSGCGSSTSNSANTKTSFTSAISTIASGVAASGNGLGSTSFNLVPMTSALCDAHGSPIETGTTNQIPTSDTRYPFVHTYCAMTVNAGDTVRGGFDLVKGLICSLEKGGIQFSGAVQSIAIDFTDTVCWPTGGPGGGSGPTTGTLTATGTAPAAFSTHFEKGVEFQFSDGSDTLTYQVAANITSNNIEFIAHESWSTGNIGVMAGSIDKTTGVLKFEKRDERVRASCDPVNGSCGWNRHTRLIANLLMSAGEPSGLTSLSYAYSDIQVSAAALSDAHINTSNGKLITASGSIAGGIKARIFSNSNLTLPLMKTPSEWVEIVNTGCMTGAGINTAANCTSNNGIDKFSSNTQFALLASTPQLSPAAWTAAFAGFNFSTIDTDVDQAF